MRVLVLDHTAALGGGELALARTLEVIDRSRFEPVVVLFADGPLRGRLEASGVRVVVLTLDPAVAALSRHDLLRPYAAKTAGTALWRHATALRRLLRDLAPDVVMGNSLKAGVIGGPVARTAGVPFVWYLRDRLSPDYLPAPVAVGCRRLLRTVSTHVVANSHATLATAGPLAAGRGSVAYSGLPDEAFAATTTDSTGHNRRLGGPQPPTRPVVALLGRVSPTKGQDVFLRAAAAVRETGVSATYRIIGAPLFGEEEYAAGLPVLAERLGLTDVVELTGWATDPMAALGEVDLLVHASPVPEPFGQVVVQGMAARVPVIATDAGGVPEILAPDGLAIMHGRVRRTPLGQLVPPGDATALAEAMTWALTHPAETSRATEAAWASARERFRLAEAAAIVETAWERAVTDGPRRHTPLPRRRGRQPAATTPAPAATGRRRPAIRAPR